MTERDDQEVLAIVLGVLGAIVLGVLLLVGAIGVWRLDAVPSADLSADAESNLAPIGNPLVRFSFAQGNAGLPELERSGGERIRAALAANSSAVVLVSSFHRTADEPEIGRDIARQRAAAVRNLLVLNGVSARRILVRPPEAAQSAVLPGMAERVEVRVQ